MNRKDKLEYVLMSVVSAHGLTVRDDPDAYTEALEETHAEGALQRLTENEFNLNLAQAITYLKDVLAEETEEEIVPLSGAI